MRPQRKLVRYQCVHCKTKYKKKCDALMCEAQPVEQKIFKVGARVTWIEKKECGYSSRHYRIDGQVVAILGPQLPDEEYNKKWLGGELKNTHVYIYEVNWICPYCRQRCSGRFYSPELRKL